MSINIASQEYPVWSFGRKLLFRGCFVFFALLLIPWIGSVPGLDHLTSFYSDAIELVVAFLNRHFFHVREVLVPVNGSGDTSYGWAELWTYLCLAFSGMLIWSLADRKRRSYAGLNYWLCLCIRYFIALVAFMYGFQKMFLLQMPFPNISQLATPLGDFLPMRFSWMFLGYSGPYQFFSGCMEVLLLWRRTATLGALTGTGVFLNVMMLHLSYDIPVKIFSMEMTACCLFLLMNEWNRLICFFILNCPAAACNIYQYPLDKKWTKWGRWTVKLIFIFIVAFTLRQTMAYASEKDIVCEPLKSGMYNVETYALNGDTLKTSPDEAMRWTDIIFEGNGRGSIKTMDTSFHHQYGRAYFACSFDSSRHALDISRNADGPVLFNAHYIVPDTSHIILTGLKGKDSLFVMLRKSTHHFQLAERQFHWLTEYN